MRILVTGATGLVGNNVVRELVKRGQQVRVLVRNESDVRSLQDLSVERVTGDVVEPTSVQAALKGIDQIVHAAGRVHIGWGDWTVQRAVNVEGTRHVARAARESGCRLLHVSSVDALGLATPPMWANESTPPGGKTPCSYVITKQQAETVVREEQARGLDAVIVNPGFMLGPWDWKPSSGRMLLAVARRGVLAAPRGGCSVCDVRDVTNGLLAALQSAPTGKQYILAGYNISYWELWRQIATVTQVRKPLFRVGPLLRVGLGVGGDLITRLTGKEPEINSASLSMSDLFHHYDSQLAKHELGYRNRDLEETLRDAWRWFRTYGYAGPRPDDQPS
jgi:dihydroflavonol-4-reductase